MEFQITLTTKEGIVISVLNVVQPADENTFGTDLIGCYAQDGDPRAKGLEDDRWFFPDEIWENLEHDIRVVSEHGLKAAGIKE